MFNVEYDWRREAVRRRMVHNSEGNKNGGNLFAGQNNGNGLIFPKLSIHFSYAHYLDMTSTTKTVLRKKIYCIFSWNLLELQEIGKPRFSNYTYLDDEIEMR